MAYMLLRLELVDFCFLMSLSGLTLALHGHTHVHTYVHTYIHNIDLTYTHTHKGHMYILLITHTCTHIHTHIPQFLDVNGTVLPAPTIGHEQELHLIPRMQVRELTPTSQRVHVEEHALPRPSPCPTHWRGAPVTNLILLLVHSLRHLMTAVVNPLHSHLVKHIQEVVDQVEGVEEEQRAWPWHRNTQAEDKAME